MLTLQNKSKKFFSRKKKSFLHSDTDVDNILLERENP